MSEEYSYRKRRRENEAKKKKQMKAAVVALICLVLVAIVIVIVVAVSKNKGDKTVDTAAQEGQEPAEEVVDESGKITEGVYIDSILVGGMEFDAAYEAVDKLVAESCEKELIIDVSGNTSTIPLKNLDIACDVRAMVDNAFKIETVDENNKVVPLEFTINDTKLQTFIEEECAQYTKKSKSATIKRKEGEFIISKSKKGTKINIADTLTAVHESVNAEVTKSASVNVEAVLDKVDPKYSTKELKQCTTLLGRFATNFSEGQTQRSANIRNAVSFINGKVVYPGEEFSVAETIYPLDSSNGYLEAPSYQAGEVVDSLGGGVCQVSTTLYNAVLRAELKVTDRSNHSMMVTYVKPAMDAAIAGDYKDLKFVNNLDMPIYIAGSAYGGTLTFSIYGKETRDSNRTVEYVSKVTNTIAPGKDIVTKDPTQPETYEKVTQSAHTGYEADLYKVVYVNGEEQSRERVNHSRYKAEPRHVIVGTMKEEEDDADDEGKKGKKKKNNQSTNEGNGNSGDSSEEPAAAVEEPATQEVPQDTQPSAEETGQDAPPEV